MPEDLLSDLVRGLAREVGSSALQELGRGVVEFFTGPTERRSASSDTPQQKRAPRRTRRQRRQERQRQLRRMCK